MERGVNSVLKTEQTFTYFQRIARKFWLFRENYLTGERIRTIIALTGDSVNNVTPINKAASYRRQGSDLIDELSLVKSGGSTVWRDICTVSRRRIVSVLRLGTPLALLRQQLGLIASAVSTYLQIRFGIGKASLGMESLQRFLYEDRTTKLKIKSRKAG